MKKFVFLVDVESVKVWMADEARISEEFHSLGADELKAREPVTVGTAGWWSRFCSEERYDRLVRKLWSEEIQD
jgi:hypothetical protein